MGRRRNAILPFTMSSRCLLWSRLLLPDLPELLVWHDDGLYCNDSDGTFSDTTYEYGVDDDDNVTFGVGAPPLPPPPLAAANDPVATYVRQMVGNTNEDIVGFFSFMMTRAQQAPAVARAPDSQEP